METESQTLTKSSSANKQSPASERIEALVVKLARFYSVMGHRPDDPGALALMAEILASSATDEELRHALTRCARECRYPVRLPDILLRIPGQEVPQPEAEARKAWDTVLDFVSRWVQSDVHGNYTVTQGVRSSGPPALSQRILETVRRSGGWRVYKTMNEEDFPFQQKRFFEEYLAWSAVSGVPDDRMLTIGGGQNLGLRQIAELLPKHGSGTSGQCSEGQPGGGAPTGEHGGFANSSR
jgi:hypothetical protein